MKFEKLNLNELRKYQLMVSLRIVLAVVGGFAIASLSVPLIASIYPDTRAVATYMGLILSFIIWLVYIITIFSVKNISKALWYSIALMLLLSIFVVLKQGALR